MRHAERKGFTLIELLIVVAIIGILAAIAIPNFLLAQTRAKISHARSEVQAFATGLEAYFVDNNSYPPMSDTTSDSTPTVFDNEHARMPNFLTTPVAYVKQVFTDPFVEFDKVLPPFGVRYTYFNYDQYINWMGWTGTIVRRAHAAGKWLIYSWGADHTMNNTAVDGVYTNYDPSNGVISIGNIIRTQRDPSRYRTEDY